MPEIFAEPIKKAFEFKGTIFIPLNNSLGPIEMADNLRGTGSSTISQGGPISDLAPRGDVFPEVGKKTRESEETIVSAESSEIGGNKLKMPELYSSSKRP